jgi:hypothetical protein
MPSGYSYKRGMAAQLLCWARCRGIFLKKPMGSARQGCRLEEGDLDQKNVISCAVPCRNRRSNRLIDLPPRVRQCLRLSAHFPNGYSH